MNTAFVWPIASVEDRPQVTLRGWAAFEVPLNGADQPWTRHLVGYCLEDAQGQVCSALQRFDPVTCSGVSKSGRIYALRGGPGLGGDADYVWQWWKSRAEIVVERDVTNELWETIQRAKSK